MAGNSRCWDSTLAPRFRDLADQTLYQARKGADYGVLAPTLKKDIRDQLISREVCD